MIRYNIYTCKICKNELTVSANQKMSHILSRCKSCKRITVFIKKVDSPKEEPRDLGYILAADLNINNDLVQIHGLPVEGNVTVKNTSGVILNNMEISYNQEKKMGGKLTIYNSSDFLLNKNIVSGDVKIESSHKFILNQNLIGHEIKEGANLITALNALLSENIGDKSIEEHLVILENFINNNENEIGLVAHKIKEANKDSLVFYGGKILSTLKKVGVDTIKTAKNKGIDSAVQWLFNLFEIMK